MVTNTSTDKTELGNYFIANYPPFSFWTKDHLPALTQAFGRPAGPSAPPLGLYLHIPFCRKRCKFCYFKVYTDVNAGAIQTYVDALSREVELLADQPAIAGRDVRFVYFGGGTPSYLSVKQLQQLVERISGRFNWDHADEVTFECEPGTLSEPKVEAIRQLGVTRLSLGVENFSDAILEENGRAHLSAEIDRSWQWIRRVDFKQVNIDLIAGMVGETWENWRVNLDKTIELSPDSVTIYQMELPFNTRYSKDIQVMHAPVAVADWSLKRDWVEYAFDRLAGAGYATSSAYTMIKQTNRAGFVYRDQLWHGADLLGAGVASFGHLAGVHYQNVDAIETYQTLVTDGHLPLNRALATTPTDRLIREMILQLKTGRLDAGYFRQKYGQEILQVFGDAFASLKDDGYLDWVGDDITLNRGGLLRIDSLLPRFFLPEHRSDRYA